MVGARWVLVRQMHSVHKSRISFQEAVLAEVVSRPGSHLLHLSLLACKMGTMIMFPIFWGCEEGGCLWSCEVVSSNPVMGYGVPGSGRELGAHLKPRLPNGAVLYSAHLLSYSQPSHRPALQLVSLSLAEELSKKDGLSLWEQTVRESRSLR